MRKLIYIAGIVLLACGSLRAQGYADFGNQTDLVSLTTSKAAGEKLTFTLAPDEVATRPQWPIVFIDWSGTGNREMINLTAETSFEVVIPVGKVVTITGENGLWTLKAIEQSVTAVSTSNATILRHLFLSKNLLGLNGNAGSDFPSNKELLSLHLDENFYKTIDVSQNPKLEVLNVNTNMLRTLDLTGVSRMKELYANKNLLSQILMPASPLGFSKIDLRVNRLNIATLPTMPAGMTAQNYLYTLQERYKLPKVSYRINEEIDLSSQLTAKGVTNTDQTTTYKWYIETDPTSDTYTELTPGVDYITVGGKTRFLRNIHTGPSGPLGFFAGMTSPAFPDLESFQRVEVVNSDEDTGFTKHGGENIQPQPGGNFVGSYSWPTDLTIIPSEALNDKTDGRTKKVYRTNPMILELNYWYGAISNDWANPANWTGGYVPQTLLADVGGDNSFIEDVEFATNDNNWNRAALRHLYVDAGKERVVRHIINHSELGKGIYVPSGTSLRVLGKVDISPDNAPLSARLHINSTPDAPNGTIYFDDPMLTPNGVEATVEFYSKGFNGNAHKQLAHWQYFGSPIQNGTKETAFSSNAIVRKYVQGAGGSSLGQDFDEKWVAVTASEVFTPFAGYEVSQPTPSTYKFKGKLNFEGPTSLVVAPKSAVFYSDFNAFANSYTAPYDISKITFEGDLDQTVYLFNTGNRENWQPLNTTLSAGDTPGQYISIPKAAAGSIPSLTKEIPSLQGFMIRTNGAGGSIQMPYSGIVRGIATNQLRSDLSTSSVGSLTMDVASDAGADRVWLLTKEGTSQTFDNGWDGRKLFSSGLPQLYVQADASYQVASAADIMHTQLGFIPPTSSSYTIYFHLENMDGRYESLALRDKLTGKVVAIEDGGSYTFFAKESDPRIRFEVVPRGDLAEEAIDAIRILCLESNRIRVENNTAQTATVHVYDLTGRVVRVERLPAGERQEYTMPHATQYVVKADNGQTMVSEKVNLVRN